MSDVLNLDEPKKRTRAEILAAAREAKAKKAGGQAAPAKETSNTSAELEFWGAALLQTMSNFQVKSVQGIEACKPVADRALEIWKEKKKELK